MKSAVAARRLLRAQRSAALGTLSMALPGYPFVTPVPFMADHDAMPVLLLSRLAEHSKNIAGDQRSSLMVYDRGPDIQSAPRLTLTGRCSRIADPDSVAMRYLGLFPGAAKLIELDFDFYRIRPVAVRYIGGFGSIHWLPVDAFVPAHSLREIETEIIEEMNTQHASLLRDCCRHLYPIQQPNDIAVVALDCDGMDLRADGELVRVEFAAPVHDAASARAALAIIAEQCRS